MCRWTLPFHPHFQWPCRPVPWGPGCLHSEESPCDSSTEVTPQSDPTLFHHILLLHQQNKNIQMLNQGRHFKRHNVYLHLNDRLFKLFNYQRVEAKEASPVLSDPDIPTPILCIQHGCNRLVVPPPGNHFWAISVHWPLGYLEQLLFLILLQLQSSPHWLLNLLSESKVLMMV